MLTISLLLTHSDQKPTLYSDRPVPKFIYCWVLSLSLNPLHFQPLAWLEGRWCPPLSESTSIADHRGQKPEKAKIEAFTTDWESNSRSTVNANISQKSKQDEIQPNSSHPSPTGTKPSVWPVWQGINLAENHEPHPAENSAKTGLNRWFKRAKRGLCLSAQGQALPQNRPAILELPTLTHLTIYVV